MRQKNKQKKLKELFYETEKSYRWGLCMKLAKYAYHSTMSEHQLEENIELICDQFQSLMKK